MGVVINVQNKPAAGTAVTEMTSALTSVFQFYEAGSFLNRYINTGDLLTSSPETSVERSSASSQNSFDPTFI